MAITLPDFTALPSVTPQAGGNLPQYPAEDPGAKALAGFGKGVSEAGGALVDIAAYRDIAQTKMDKSTADADFTNRTIPLTEQLKVETDPEKITALRGQFREALQTAGNAFSNPEARDFWMKSHAHVVATGQAAADFRNSEVYQDQYLAGTLKQTDDLVRNGASASDPIAFDLARGRIEDLWKNAVTSGQTKAVIAQQHQAKALGDMVAGRIATLNARGRGDEARALLDTHRGELGPVMAGHLDDTIAVAGERKRGQDEKKQGEDYERWLNGEGPRPAAPGARPRLEAGGAPGGAADGQTYWTPQGLAALRPTESPSYDKIHYPSGKPSTASGAYGFLDRTWREQAPQAGVDITKYPRAYMAPPAMQDAVAAITPISHWTGVDAKGKPFNAAAQQLAKNSAYVAGGPAGTAAPAAPGAAPVPTARAPAPAGGVEIVAGGDSIGVGLNRQNKLGGTSADNVQAPEAALSDAAGSRNPQQGLDYIKTHPERFAGKNVYWSTGLFNAGGPDKARAALSKVGEQLDALQAAGANAVVLVGLDNGRFASLNPELAKIAADKGVQFAGALPTDNIHPSAQGYRDYHAAAVKLFPSSGSSTASPLPAGAGGDQAAPAAGQAPGEPPGAPIPGVDYPYGGTPAPGGGDQAAAAAPPAGQLEPGAPEGAPTTPPTAAPGEPKPAPDWAALAQRIRDSDLPPGAKTTAFQKLEERRRMFEFGKQEALPKYNAQVHAAVEQRIDDIVQGAARSDDPEVRRKAEGDLATIIKWGVDSGAIPANKGYEAERTAKSQLVTERAQYLDAGGKSDEALALIQQNKDTLPPQIYQEQVRNLTSRAEQQQGTRFERELQIGGGPGYVPGEPTPGMMPGGPADFPTPLAPSPFQQKLQAIADSDLPDGAKKAAHAAALSRHELEVVGQDRARSDLEMSIRKGEAGRLDVEQAYRQGRIAPAARTEMNRELDKIDAERNAAAAAMAKVNNVANGGAPLDPKSEYDKKALNYHFDKVSAGWPANETTARSIDYATKYGLIPDRLKGLIRGSLHSGSPADMVAAAGTITQIRNRNPQLVGEIGDENDLRLATLLQTYTDAGIRPDRAVELATSGMKVGAPEREARSQAFDDERGKSKVDQHASDTSWLSNQLNSIWRADPDVDPMMRKEFEEVSKAEYQRTGNLEASRRMALDNINNIWGRTRVGGDLRYMKQAPEKYYSVPGLSDRENASWMNEQLASDMRTGSLQDPSNPITSDRLHLVQAPDRTAPDGRPAYQVWLEHPATKAWELVTRPDGQARVWAPDWTTSAEKLRRDAAHQTEMGVLRQERAVGPSVGVGAGP